MNQEMVSLLWNMSHILVIGKTNVGKSSLIRLITNDETIKVAKADDTNSCTKDIACYLTSKFDESNKNQILTCFYDTQGTQDSDALDQEKDDQKKNDNNCNESNMSEVTDEKNEMNYGGINEDGSILNKIQKRIYSNGGNLVKIIWVVPNERVSNAFLQYQARFINKLNDSLTGDNCDSHKNIWDSVLLIVSEPKVDETWTNCAQGAIAASKHNGNTSTKFIENKNLIGYTNIDWFDKSGDNKKYKRALRRYDEQLEENHRDYHYYKSNEIVSMVNDCLYKHISSYSISWRNDVCIKCGLVGDCRFLDDVLFCHPIQMKIKQHAGKLKRVHLGDIDKNKHSKQYHPGKLIRYHPKPASNRYHSGKLKWTHSQHFLGGYVSDIGHMIWEGRDYQRKVHDVQHNWAGRSAARVLGVTKLLMSPLFLPVDAVIHKMNDSCAYCNTKLTDKYRTGCMWVYDCCDSYETSKGCKTHENGEVRYLCCGRKQMNAKVQENGCMAYYACCPDKKFHASINATKHPKGCITECTNCGADNEFWIVSADDDNNLKCGFEWQCCQAKGKWEDKFDEKLKCQEICNRCNQKWGESEGCTPLIKHQFVSAYNK